MNNDHPVLEAKLGPSALIWPALPALIGVLSLVVGRTGFAAPGDEDEFVWGGIILLVVASVVLFIIRRVRAFVLENGDLVVRVLGEDRVNLNRLSDVRILPEGYRAQTASYHLTLVDDSGASVDLHEQWSWVPRAELWRYVQEGVQRSDVIVSGVTQTVLARLSEK